MKSFLRLVIGISIMCWILGLQSFAIRFSDVDKNNDWSFMYINELTDKGILSGFPDGTFRPYDKVTREQFAKVLAKSFYIKLSDNTSKFNDVESIRWSSKYIEEVNAFLPGYEVNGVFYFKPEDNAIREDIIASVVKALELDKKYQPKYELLKDFKDENEISNDLKGCIALAYEFEIIRGDGSGSFNPKGELSRQEMASLISYTMTKLVTNWYRDDIQVVFTKKKLDAPEFNSELKYYVDIPQITIKGKNNIAKKIQDYLTNEKIDENESTYSLLYNYDELSILGVTNDYLTINHFSSGYSGGTSLLYEYVETFDLNTGNVLKLDDIIISKQRFVDDVSTYLAKEALIKYGEFNGKEYNDENLLEYKNKMSKYIEDGNWGFLSDGSIYITTKSKYEIADGASGVVNFVIPNNYLTSSVKSRYLPIS